MDYPPLLYLYLIKVIKTYKKYREPTQSSDYVRAWGIELVKRTT